MIRKPIILLLCVFLPVLSDGDSLNLDISPGLALVFDSSAITRGGLEQSSNNRALLEVSLDLNSGTLFKATRSNIFISAQSFRGDDAGADAGVLQAFSNIDEDPFSEIYDYWYQGIFKDNLRVKIGQVDANSEFAQSEQAGLFMHSSMGYSPTILSLPTYPDPALSVNLFYRINSLFSASIGFYDVSQEDTFDEIFTISELTLRYHQNGSLSLGYWKDSNASYTLTGQQLCETHGYYGVLDQTLPLTGVDSTLGMFLQWGSVKNDIAIARQHIGAGLVWHVPFGISAASTGIGISALRLSDAARAETGNFQEVALELFYAYVLNDVLTFKPTISYIINPGAYPSIDNASIITLRTEIQL